MTGVTKSIELLEKRGYCSNKLGYLYCKKSHYCTPIVQMFFSVINGINKCGYFCHILSFEVF